MRDFYIFSIHAALDQPTPNPTRAIKSPLDIRPRDMALVKAIGIELDPVLPHSSRSTMNLFSGMLHFLLRCSSMNALAW